MILVDANNFSWRAYFAASNLRSDTGFPTGLLHIGLSMLATFRERFDPQLIVFLWDGRNPWKKKKFEEYKATRFRDESIRKEVYCQIDIFQKLLTAIGVPQIQEDGYEADDLAGLFVGANPNKKIILVSGDADWLQLLTKNVTIIRQWSDRTVKVTTRKMVRKQFGVRTCDFARYQALVGDKGDNIPKVRKFMRTAHIVDHINEGFDLKLTSQETARLCRNLELTTIRTQGKCPEIVIPIQTKKGRIILEQTMKKYQLISVWSSRHKILEVGKWSNHVR